MALKIRDYDGSASLLPFYTTTLRIDTQRYLRSDIDPREIPSYSVPDAARYLTIPVATVRAWVTGRPYMTLRGSKRFQPVITLASHDPPLLSFFNLAEAHVLRALRNIHRIRLTHIRKAITYVRKRFGWPRPLIQQQFQTDGIHLFVEHLGELIDATAHGQLAMKEVIEAHLHRLEWQGNVVARLYPFTQTAGISAPKSVFIDPRFSFGRPLLRGSGVETQVIAQRYKAGDSIDDLMKDYECSRSEIEEGIRCELRLSAAA